MQSSPKSYHDSSIDLNNLTFQAQVSFFEYISNIRVKTTKRLFLMCNMVHVNFNVCISYVCDMVCSMQICLANLNQRVAALVSDCGNNKVMNLLHCNVFGQVVDVFLSIDQIYVCIYAAQAQAEQFKNEVRSQTDLFQESQNLVKKKSTDLEQCQLEYSAELIKMKNEVS